MLTIKNHSFHPTLYQAMDINGFKESGVAVVLPDDNIVGDDDGIIVIAALLTDKSNS
jgi:regulator of RNase E activity RraA